MSEDLEQRLRSFPETVAPPQAPDVRRIQKGGVRRRRARRAVAGVTTAAVLGVGGLVSMQLIQAGPEPARSAPAAQQEGEPDGWTRHENAEWGVSVSAPESWQLRWGEANHVAVASFPFDDGGYCEAGGPLATLPTDGVFLWMFEAPDGSGWDFQGRPADLSLDERTLASYEGIGCQDAYRVLFEDDDRFFVTYVAFGHDVSEADRGRATEVLDSVEVAPR